MMEFCENIRIDTHAPSQTHTVCTYLKTNYNHVTVSGERVHFRLRSIKVVVVVVLESINSVVFFLNSGLI